MTIGLLTDAAGFPPMVSPSEGPQAETVTAAQPLPDDLSQAFEAIHRAQPTCALA